jgi:uncharacterized membrane protein
MIAAVLGLRIKYSLTAIVIGVFGSAVIMSVLTYGLLDYIVTAIQR